MYEEVDKSWYEWCSIPEQKVFPLQPPQFLSSIFVKEGQIDITRHGESPQSVCGHEPVPSQPNDLTRISGRLPLY